MENLWRSVFLLFFSWSGRLATGGVEDVGNFGEASQHIPVGNNVLWTQTPFHRCMTWYLPTVPPPTWLVDVSEWLECRSAHSHQWIWFWSWNFFWANLQGRAAFHAPLGWTFLQPRHGGLCVLDGLQQLRPMTLSALAPLIQVAHSDGPGLFEGNIFTGNHGWITMKHGFFFENHLAKSIPYPIHIKNIEHPPETMDLEMFRRGTIMTSHIWDVFFCWFHSELGFPLDGWFLRFPVGQLLGIHWDDGSWFWAFFFEFFYVQTFVDTMIYIDSWG